MKIIYLIDSNNYNYHKKLAADFVSITGGEITDTAGADPGILYYEIKVQAPRVIITFDLAGHVFRTGSDTLSLNNIYARFAHILFHRSDHYAVELKARQNLSMFTFIPNGEDVAYYRDRYPDVPNIDRFVPFIYNASDEYEQQSNLANIRQWWNDFQRKAML